MSNNIFRPITMTKGFLVFKFHPQFLQLLSQTLGYFYESRQKSKSSLTPLFFGNIGCSIAYRVMSTELYLYIWRWRSRISAEAKNMADQATYSHEVFTDHS